MKNTPENNKKECNACLKMENSFSILKSDYEFEFRKLSEDRLTQKILYEMNCQKQIKKWQEKYQKEKSERDENNQNWMKKIDQVKEKYHEKEQELEKNCINKYEADISILRASLSKENQQLRRQFQNQLSQKDLLHSQHRQHLELDFLKQIKDLENQHARTLKHLTNTYESNILKKNNQNDSLVTGLKSELSAEEKSHKNTKRQYKIQQEKLMTEIYYLKSDVSNKNKEIQDLQEINQEKIKQIDAKAEEIKQLIKSHDDEMVYVQRLHKKQVEDLQCQQQSEINCLYKKQLEITKNYERSITILEEKKQKEKILYDYNIGEIKNCIENRPSRLEDLEEILILKEKLEKITTNCLALEKELLSYKLELENKEDVYNKIFLNNQSQNCIENYFLKNKKKDLKLKRAGKSVTTVKQILGQNNGNLLPFVGNGEKKTIGQLIIPRSSKIL